MRQSSAQTGVKAPWIQRQKGPRNFPTLLNAVYRQAQFWDGRILPVATDATQSPHADPQLASAGRFLVFDVGGDPHVVRSSTQIATVDFRERRTVVIAPRTVA
jgi:hypothetical protein